MALSDLYRYHECPKCHSWRVELGGYCLELKCPITGIQMPFYRCLDCGWRSDPLEQRKEVADRVGNFLIELGKRIKDNEK